MKAIHKLILSIISGLLFFVSWPNMPLVILIFFAFMPLLVIENYSKNLKGFFVYCYISILIWNCSTTWWVYNATAAGAIFTFIVNSMLMCIPLVLFYFTKRKTNKYLGYMSFIIYYLAFEYFHLHWDLSWPWLTLGNIFASHPNFVQWYEYTGTLGGSAWILSVNVILYLTFQRFLEYKKIPVIPLASSLSLILIPLMTSLIIYSSYSEQGVDQEIVVVQPNIDPYVEKYPVDERFIPYEKQFERLIALSKQQVTDSTTYLVWPETALPVYVHEPEVHQDEIVSALKDFMKTKKELVVITGLDSYLIYGDKKNATATSRRNDRVGYYDVFNTAIKMDSSGKIHYYHKSKLVPGVETLPYPAIFGILTESLGGIVGTLGIQKERTVFYNNHRTGVAPLICYESIFGEFTGKFVENGANILLIITNDGWWGDTPGHKQHFQYARLRAIENRKSIARSANTGISGFINQRGDILEQTAYWKQDVRKRKIKANNIVTFYAKHGDYIGLIALYISALLIMTTIGYKFLRK